MKAKKVSFCGLLTALAIVLSLAERLFPLDAVVPVPGVKLGLANVVRRSGRLPRFPDPDSPGRTRQS